MAEVKKIMISVPDRLLQEVDGLARKESKNRSECFQEAIMMYLAERDRERMREEMKDGYQFMAELNLDWASLCLPGECRDYENYVMWLMERE